MQADKLYSIRSTKGFSLDEELRAYDGTVPATVFAEPSVEADELVDHELFYQDVEEQQHAQAESSLKESLNAYISSALRKVTSKIGSPAYSRRPAIVPLSRLPLKIEEELGHFMYSSPEVLPEELE